MRAATPRLSSAPRPAAVPTPGAMPPDPRAGSTAIPTEALARLGIPATYVDALGQVQTPPAPTLTALAAAIGSSQSAEHPLVCVPGQPCDDLVGDLRDLTGITLEGPDGIAPAPGYYHLFTPDGRRRLVISAPDQLPQPARGWGWAVQLYAARSRASWGIGDFGDLTTITRAARDSGASTVLISPVHAAAPVPEQQSSPYSPTSRQWLQLLHIAVGDAPGAAEVDLSDLAHAGRALNTVRKIDRDTVWVLKRTALERIWAATRDHLPAEHDAWVAERGQDLTRFATWCVLAENYGTSNWQEWDEADQHPDTSLEFAATHAERVAFYAWAQWIADSQLAAACAAGGEVDVVVDIAVGFDSCSADAWANQDQVCFAFEVGCPPDGHNIDGQKWGLPPINPVALVATDLDLFIKMVRVALRHAGALRIDHVMQLWRLFWVPSGGSATQGAYVNYPTEAMLAVLRVEASWSGAWVVGEDMGTVADGVRETMADVGMLGYRAALRLPVDKFPEAVMGASSTHDQATIAGTLTGSDTADLRAIGKPSNFEALEQVRRELAAAAGIDPDGPIGPDEVHRAILAQYRRLSACKARVVLASLDDVGAVAERPNMPGTVAQWPNWCLSLPRPVEDILAEPLARDLADVLGARCTQ
ncbi:4-alpha-glucanotransferase [Pengzhenrongella frigida]|uniref:4-alpha-glucanotransferase n=1 Tax=Pengzhenrongella frigida TaxID=1259133 RepID=A0A4Q5N401_9MICO|nr:4-alpha-glucanotransferase [Cellulomonas sp. HLT2-17]RYV52978.1 4-alpha-glucanotransferase [Cellulomonas sp. HLT2-17]